MSRNRRIIVLVLLFTSTSVFAELVKIRTNNQHFFVEEKVVLEGPPGYLKSALQNSSTMTTRYKDGSIYANVAGKTMQIALNYIKHFELDAVPASPNIRKELIYLFPQLESVLTIKKPSKLWYCGAYCYSGIDQSWRFEGFLIASDLNIFSAWQELNAACTAKITGKRKHATLTKHMVALNIDVGKSGPAMKEVCILQQP